MSEVEDFQNHHLPMPCKFCPNMAAHSPLHELSAEAFMQRFSIYFCSNCHAEYIYKKRGPLYSWSLYTTINEKVYRWSLLADHSSATLWLVKVPGVPGIRVNKGMKLIKAFDGDLIPDITPININDKVRTWLVFL